MKKKCLCCGKELSKIQKKFCSHSCYSKWHSGKRHHLYVKKIKRKCLICGKIFEVNPSGIRRHGYITAKYCSRKCFDKGQKNGKFINCVICGKKIYATPTRIKRGIKTCSKTCLGKLRTKTRSVIINCLTCGKEVKVPIHEFRIGKGKYCSRTCQNIYQWNNNSEYRDKIIKKIRSIQKPTKPEKQLIEIIRKYNLPYKYVGNGKFWIENINPDFVEINGRKICVEVFGHYWHEPLLKKNLKWDKTVIGRKEKLKEYGWKCIIFWENELNEENVMKVLEEAK